MVRPGPDLDAMLLRIDDLVASHGAVPRGELTSIRRHLPAITARLVARGYGIGSTIRVPLQRQLRDLVQAGFVPKKGLERRLAGASAREVKEHVQRMVQRGELLEVIRESGPGLVTPSQDALDPGDLEELLRCLVKVEKLVRRARSTRGASPTVLRTDVVGPLSRWTGSMPVPPSATPRPHTELSEMLTLEIRKRFRENPLPIRIPDLLRSMGAPIEESKRALIDGAAQGLFELEPESGMARLSREDAELCPPGPMGTRLSWVIARDGKEVHS